MKSEIIKFLSVLLVVAGSSFAWAQACPTSPSYATDFSSNQNCLTLNGTTPGYPGFYPAVTGTGVVLRVTPNATSTAGSAWFNTQQPVSGAFSTTFTFQLSGSNTSLGPADGFAFVIQAAGSSALGPIGCGIGFGDSSSGCAPPTGGIPNSLAIEFNTYANYGVDSSGNTVTIQNCMGTGANNVDPTCTIALNSNLASVLADGNVHTVSINYSGPSTKLLDVILDSNDLFPGGVAFDLTTIGLNAGGTAFVGFTAATGGGDDNHDIQTWTFTPLSQTVVISQAAPTIVPFTNAAGNTAYDFTAQLTAPYSTPEMKIKPILMTAAQCDALVQKNFWPARCFVYENAENTGMDAAVLFEVTCPDSPGGTCGSNEDENFFATLGTDFNFTYADNPFFIYPGFTSLVNPLPGFLKGEGPNSLAPCTPPTSGPLFQSNQINAFFVDSIHTTGGSGGGASCWVSVYDTPYELPPGVKITSPGFTTYTQGQVVTANYTCSNPSTSKPTTSATGPYLTVATCSQSEIPKAPSNANTCNSVGGQIQCTGPVDTSVLGLHTFFVTSLDSGSNQSVQLVVYNVKKH